MEATLEFESPFVGPAVRIALIQAEGIADPFAADRATAFLAEAAARAAELGPGAWPPGRRERVRDLLRFGKFRPSGRSKPASEFLLAAAQAAAVPFICGPVDVNNAVSLETGFPGSVFDAALTGPRLLIRRGRGGESYVFNPTGQVIELQDLLVVCRWNNERFEPCGNPVKDAMATKIQPTTRSVVAVLYGPEDEPDEALRRAGERFAALLCAQCQARWTAVSLHRSHP